MNARWEEKVKRKLQAGGEAEEFSRALRQWKHTGAFKDHGAAIAACELCGHSGLRYHYLIANQQTGEALWVGSQCILNFEAGEHARFCDFDPEVDPISFGFPLRGSRSCKG